MEPSHQHRTAVDSTPLSWGKDLTRFLHKTLSKFNIIPRRESVTNNSILEAYSNSWNILGNATKAHRAPTGRHRKPLSLKLLSVGAGWPWGGWGQGLPREGTEGGGSSQRTQLAGSGKGYADFPQPTNQNKSQTGRM